MFLNLNYVTEASKYNPPKGEQGSGSQKYKLFGFTAALSWKALP